MDKKTAQQTLVQLQKSIADAERQAKELQAIIDKPDVPVFYQGRLVTVTSEGASTTFFLDSELDVRNSITRTPTKTSPNGKRLAAGLSFDSRESAEEYRAYLEVRQKARVAMAVAWGNQTPTWVPSSESKYCITYSEDNGGRAKVETYQYTWQPIHFPTKATATAFLESLTEEEAKLLLTGM